MTVRSKLPRVGTTIFTVMSQRAAELQAVNLGQGFPDYDIDPRIGELVHEAMRQGYNQYAPMPGMPQLREAIAAKLNRSYAVRVDPELEITVTLGATEAIFSAVQALVAAGDEVVVFDPAYDSYEPAVRACRRCLHSRAAAAAAVPLRLGPGESGAYESHAPADHQLTAQSGLHLHHVRRIWRHWPNCCAAGTFT